MIISASFGLTEGRADSDLARVTEAVPTYKVALGTETAWGEGGYYHSEMADAASQSGFNAVFFADKDTALENSGVQDAGFENVTASGSLVNWSNFTDANSQIGFTQANRTLAHNGFSSLEFALENNSTSLASRYVRDTPLNASHRLHLFGDVEFQGYLYVANMTLGKETTTWETTYHRTHRPAGYVTIHGGNIFPIWGSEAWVYLEVTLRSTYSSPHNTNNTNLRVFFVYDYRYDFNTSPKDQNDTSTYYLYLPPPNDAGWYHFSANLTKLASELWNQTIVDYWWVDSVELGVRSALSAHVDALFDDVSVTTDDFRSLMQYLRNVVTPDISTDKMKAYPAYLHTRTIYPVTFTVLGGNATVPLGNDSLAAPADWQKLWHEISGTGSLLLINSPVEYGMYDRMKEYNGMGLPVVDLSDDLPLWDYILSRGGEVMIASGKMFLNESDFANPNIWTTRVWADNSSENTLLEAMYLGHSYLARNWFNGTFQLDSLGFLPGRLPIYVANQTGVLLHVRIGGISGGAVRFTRNATEIAVQQIPSSGDLERTFAFGVPDNLAASYFRVVVTNSTGSIVVISNPIFFARRQMLPGSYIYVSNPAVQIRGWTWTDFLDQRRLSLNVTRDEQEFPVSTYEALYLRLPANEPRYSVKIGNVTIPANDFYDGKSGLYIVPLTGISRSLMIELSLDRSVLETLIDIGRSTALLYVLAMSPILISAAYFALDERRKRRRPHDWEAPENAQT
jgi:hypothetical protein